MSGGKKKKKKKKLFLEPENSKASYVRGTVFS